VLRTVGAANLGEWTNEPIPAWKGSSNRFGKMTRTAIYCSEFGGPNFPLAFLIFTLPSGVIAQSNTSHATIQVSLNGSDPLPQPQLLPTSGIPNLATAGRLRSEAQDTQPYLG